MEDPTLIFNFSTFSPTGKTPSDAIKCQTFLTSIKSQINKAYRYRISPKTPRYERYIEQCVFQAAILKSCKGRVFEKWFDENLERIPVPKVDGPPVCLYLRWLEVLAEDWVDNVHVGRGVSIDSEEERTDGQEISRTRDLRVEDDEEDLESEGEESHTIQGSEAGEAEEPGDETRSYEERISRLEQAVTEICSWAIELTAMQD